MNAKLPFIIRRKQFWGILILGFLLLFSKSIFHFALKKSAVQFDKQLTWSNVRTSQPKVVLSEFDPNELDEQQWEKLGFSKKQIATILKYKNIIGGRFLSKVQLKKCYAISDEKYAEIEPYILLPETHKKENNFDRNYDKFDRKQVQVSQKFNPDKLSITDWQNMGFSEKQAIAIDKYKKYLGGTFVSKEKFKECFIISDENYKKLEAYLILPEKTPSDYNKFYAKNEGSKNKIHLKPFDPNQTDLDGWKGLGFSEKQAQVIVNYRDRNLKGQFRTMEDLKNCFVISDEKFKELEPYIRINTEHTNPVEKKEAVAVQHNPTDFSTIDLNKISYRQLTEFGFSEKDAAMILGFRKKLGGFMKAQQLVDTYEIDKSLAEKLISTVKLNTDQVQKYSLTDAPEAWLKSHPYFKYSAEKILFYRISNPDSKKILKFLKLKPEYENQMKLYLTDF